ncbi:MAG TPA: twin-arginine translocase TatA/TatE family subunit [Rhizomicrobium sp.]|nr:twin-arginine translocase TatA/TatE family subunit [Rhizomicrobium sp.]
MFGLSFWHIAILALLLFLLFGGKLSDLMGAAGKGLRQHGDEIVPTLGNRLMPPFLQRIVQMLFKK